MSVYNCNIGVKTRYPQAFELIVKRSKARFTPSSLMVFVLNPFKPVTSFQQPKEVTKKDRSLLKFLTAKNGLFLGRFKCVHPTSTQMTPCHLPQE
jgi:hypothetical protein